MRVMVLGGTGLISTPLVDELVERGHETVAFNRGITKVRHGEGVRTILGDRNDPDQLDAAIAEAQPDAVIDMLTFDAHSADLAVAAFRNASLKQYIFCSTTAVYGPLSQLPALESEPHTPLGQYGGNKSEAEQVFIRARDEEQFPVTILRPAHTYGPGQFLPSLWGYDACLVPRIRTDKKVLVPGDGFGAFQLNYCDDVASAFVHALDTDATLGQVYTIAPTEYMDWRMYLNTLGQVLGKEVNLVPVSSNLLIAGSPPDAAILLEEMYQFPMAYDSRLFREHVPGWIAATPLHTGLDRTVKWLTKTNAHMNPDEQSWIDPLIDKLLDFEKDLALSEFAFDDSIFSQE